MELTKKEKLLMYGLVLESEFFGQLGLLKEEDGEEFLRLQQETYKIDKNTTPEDLVEMNKEQMLAAEGLLTKMKETLNQK